MGAAGTQPDAANGLQDYIGQAIKVRQHLKRMQSGTPLLLRHLDADGVEELQICTFWLSMDLKTLRWREQEGDASTKELPLSYISEVVEDAESRKQREAVIAGEEVPSDDGHYALSLVLNKRPPHLKTGSMSLDIICASSEDLESWYKGLVSLVECGASTQAGNRHASSDSAKASARQAPDGAGSALRTSAVGTALHEQLRAQEEEIAKLKQENGCLKDLVARKDVTIAALQRDLSDRPSDRHSKTESTSRESDDHLRDREVTILRRKNQKLLKALRQKQHTVSDLLQMLGKLTQQQGAESDFVTEDDGGDKDEPESGEESVEAAACAAMSTAAAGAPCNVSTRREPARPLATSVVPSTHVVHGDEAMKEAALDSDEAIEEDEEVRELAGKLARLEREMEGLGSRVFQASPHSFAAPSAGARPSVPPGDSMEPSVAKAVRSSLPGQQPMQFDFSAVRAVVASPAIGVKSAAALQALATEMEVLEAKKRVVEQLARCLEPAPDHEEHDGFPLR